MRSTPAQIDQNIDTAQDLGGPGCCMSYRLKIGDIRRDLEMAAASTGSATQDRDATAAFVKQLRSRSTNPAGATCDQRGQSLEVSQKGHQRDGASRVSP